MEQEVESLVPESNGYLYQHRVGEMGENAKRQGKFALSGVKCSVPMFFE